MILYGGMIRRTDTLCVIAACWLFDPPFSAVAWRYLSTRGTSYGKRERGRVLAGIRGSRGFRLPDGTRDAGITAEAEFSTGTRSHIGRHARQCSGQNIPYFAPPITNSVSLLLEVVLGL